MGLRILVIGSPNSDAVRAARAVATAEKLEVIQTWKSGDEMPLLVVVNATATGEEVNAAILYMSGICGQRYRTAIRCPRVYVMAKSERATKEELRLEHCFPGGRVERFDQRYDSAVLQLRLILRAAKQELEEDHVVNMDEHYKVAL